MKKVRMLLTGTIVIAIVGSSLAFKKTDPNLFACVNNQCILVAASSIIPSVIQLDPINYYNTNTSTTNIVCFKAGSTTQGCSSTDHPAQAWTND